MISGTERFNLIKEIAVKLQAEYTFSDIDIFLAGYKVTKSALDNSGSKRIHVQNCLAPVDNCIIEGIASDLKTNSAHPAYQYPKNWEKVSDIKAFISHLSGDKDKAINLKNTLKAHNIEGFVAHEDIKPSLEWQKEIQKALHTCDFFISLNTKGFSQSVWCQQEVGFALARGVVGISVKFDEDPQGFMGDFQALIRGTKDANQVASEMVSILKGNPETQGFFKVDPNFVDDIPF